MVYLGAILLFVVGGFIGLKFPDFDHAFHWLPLIGHRSVLTHGLLVPLLFVWGLRKHQDPPARLFLMGLCIGTAVHLAFDLFPWIWRGYSLIYVPFYGRTDTVFSWVWMFASILVCLLLAGRRIEKMRDFYVAFIGLIVAYGVSASAEPRASFWALIVLLPLAFVGFVARKRTDSTPPFK